MRSFMCTCIVFLAGCQAFSVHKGEEKIKGIPFYAKVAVFQQETQWARSWVEVVLDYSVIDPSSGKVTAKQSTTLIADPKLFDQPAAVSARELAANQLNKGFEAVESAFRAKFQDLCKCVVTESQLATQTDPEHASAPNLLQTLISNQTKVITLVDPKKKYQFNSKTPPFGTAAATIKLASDGTLTEASSTVDSTKLADLIPLKELLIDRLGLKDPIPASGQPLESMDKVPVLTLTVKSNGYHYRFSRIDAPSQGVTLAANLNLEPLKFGESQNMVRTEFGSKSPGASKDDSIQISGTVRLPEK